MYHKKYFTALCIAAALTAMAGETAKFPFVIRNIEAGSVADYSFLNHKPAGKYGYLTNQNGDFTFADGQKIRFFGINLVDDRVMEMDHRQTEELAQNMAALGINMVRIHHISAKWQKAEPLFAQPEKSTLAFNDKALEKLDYLLYQLKQNGIYVTMEIVDSALIPLPLEMPNQETIKNGNVLKILMMIDDDVKQYCQTWAKNFFCRTNRYTGQPLIADPQLAVMGIVNEISMGYHNGKLDNLSQYHLNKLREKFTVYLQTQKLPSSDFDPELKDSVSAQFWNQQLRDAYVFWTNYLRQIGYHGLISGSNFGENFFHHEPSAICDFMDAHLYWGYASWSKNKSRMVNNNWSDLLKYPRNENNYTKELFARFSTAAVAEKPLISSEHRTANGGGNPSTFDDAMRYSEYRAAGLPFFATIQAFQNWDGFYVFASQGIGSLKNEERMGHLLDVRYDTTYLATFPLSAYLLRGNVISSARKKMLITITDEDIYGKPQEPSFLADGLFYYPEQHSVAIQYPRQTVDQKQYDEVIPLSKIQKMNLPATTRITADTGDFFRNFEEGYFVVNTAKVQGVEGFFYRTKQHAFKNFQMEIYSDFGVCFVAAKTGNIADSDRLLFLVVAGCENQDDGKGRQAKGWVLPGKGPVLLEPVTGKLSFVNNRYDIWILGEKGERVCRIAENAQEFLFDTGRDKTIWYELVKH